MDNFRNNTVRIKKYLILAVETILSSSQIKICILHTLTHE